VEERFPASVQILWDTVPVVQEARWTPGPVRTCAANLASHWHSITGPSSRKRFARLDYGLLTQLCWYDTSGIRKGAFHLHLIHLWFEWYQWHLLDTEYSVLPLWLNWTYILAFSAHQEQLLDWDSALTIETRLCTRSPRNHRIDSRPGARFLFSKSSTPSLWLNNFPI
jgi:hypothetical protein